VRVPVLVVALVGCTEPEIIPDFTVVAGIETATVYDAPASAPLTLYDADGTELLTLIADAEGRAHFAYVPEAPVTIAAEDAGRFPIARGTVLEPGDDYEIRVEDRDPPLRSGPFRVLSIDDPVPDGLYDAQELDGIHSSPLTGDDGDPEDGFQYVQTRDGTLLSVMVRFPDPLLYGDGPWPTVIEYSGYSPSRPDRPDTGSQIANALGYATVGVNLRGTGCSGGVFDVFNRAQHADGYDVVEVVARQEWVLGGRVGMVGLSYPGITQLFVASTNPPSLAGVVPLSTIADPWEMQWPGGIYNSGFTRTWVAEREAESAANGQSWVAQRVEAGDTTCADNQVVSHLSIDFETFLHNLEFRPNDADDRDLRLLSRQIEAPVFLGGAWQDEQTGAQFGAMLDQFESSADARFVVQNGRHPDGYAPSNVYRWFEFLEFHVAGRIPVVNPLIESFGAQEFGNAFGLSDFEFPAPRFDPEGDFDAAYADYLDDSRVLVLFESGAGGADVGAPVPTFEATYDVWPPPSEPFDWFLRDGALAATAGAEGADTWRFDPNAGSDTFFGPSGYQLLEPLWDLDWQRFADADMASFVSPAFDADTVVAGPGVAELWIRSPVDDAQVQVTLTEVRPDGTEVLVQSGWLRLGHRAAGSSPDLRIHRSFSEGDFEPLPIDEWFRADVQIPSFAHPVRAGSRLRMIVSTPGRDHGTWEFEPPTYTEQPVFEVGFGGAHASKLRLTTLPDLDVPETRPPCPSLRGQPCREYVADGD
jgi:predicted acyl esterase